MLALVLLSRRSAFVESSESWVLTLKLVLLSLSVLVLVLQFLLALVLALDLLVVAIEDSSHETIKTNTGGACSAPHRVVAPFFWITLVFPPDSAMEQLARL